MSYESRVLTPEKRGNMHVVQDAKPDLMIRATYLHTTFVSFCLALPKLMCIRVETPW